MKNHPNSASSQERHTRSPEKRRGWSKAQKGLAAITLALVTAASVAVLKEPTAEFLHIADAVKTEDVDTDLVEKGLGMADNNFSLADYKVDAENPNILVNDKGIETKEISACTLAPDEEIAISIGASFRDAPFIGDGVDTITTVATAKQIIELDGTCVKEYYIYSPENYYEDYFIGIKASELPVELANELNLDGVKRVDIYWIKTGEAMIQKKVMDNDTENESASQLPAGEESFAG